MISLEQIQTLNTKVQNALDVIVGLREENGALRAKLGDYEKRMEELEVLVNSFSREQDDIENGILNILQQLDRLEDDFSSDDVVEPSDPSESMTPEQSGPAAETALPEETSESDGTESAPVSEKESVEAVAEEPVSNELKNSPEPVTVPAAEPTSEKVEKSEPEAELDIF